MGAAPTVAGSMPSPANALFAFWYISRTTSGRRFSSSPRIAFIARPSIFSAENPA